METTVIKDELQYAAYLEEVKRLAAMDPGKGSPEGEQLQLLAILVEKYEQERFIVGKPDPIDAIEFRMAEYGWKQKDLADILGSKSRASEILGRKRNLTLEMVRLLQERLRIPADVLVQPVRRQSGSTTELDWSRFPVREMTQRGWLKIPNSSEQSVAKALGDFFAQLANSAAPVLMRRTIAGSIEDEESRYAIYAWIARVLIRARGVKRANTKYEKGSITDEFLNQVAKLSWTDKGPLLAQEFLAMKGIALVIEPHLPGTRVDGAAMLDEDGTPVIGLTVRHDRSDNFWFTLMHELAHVRLHLDSPDKTFVDDTEEGNDTGKIEAEANQQAADVFVPRTLWRRSSAYRLKTPDAVLALANELRISPAVVAGRIRKETANYRLLTKLVGHGAVRKCFTDVKWPYR